MNTSVLDSLCSDFVTSRGNAGEFEAIADRIETIPSIEVSSNTNWFEAALQDEEKKWFVAWVFRNNRPIPRNLFGPMILAAVYERNPSANDQFVQPCLRSFGVIAVNEALLKYVESGTNFEKSGAVNALYWAQRMGRDGIAAVDLTEIRARKKRLLITEFVQNTNVDVRRSIIPALDLDPANYPDDLKPLIPEAIKIAREHPDDYIRHRVEVQLGNVTHFKALPSRAPNVR